MDSTGTMAETGIQKREAEIVRLRSRLAGIRGRVDESAGKIQRVATGGAAAFLFGSWAKSRAAMSPAETVPTIAGLPPLLIWAVGGYIAGEMIDGRTGELVQDGALGLLHAYAYQLGSQP